MTGCSSCKKDAPPLPDNPYGLPNATQSGANMFACRINGKNYIVAEFNGINFISRYHYSNTRDTFGMAARGSFADTSIEPVRRIGFVLNHKIKEGGTYYLNDSSESHAYIFREYSPCTTRSGYSNVSWAYATEGSVTITKYSGIYTIPSCCYTGLYDATAIVTGTFNFIIPIPNCDTLKVTDGRFDINYSQY